MKPEEPEMYMILREKINDVGDEKISFCHQGKAINFDVVFSDAEQKILKQIDDAVWYCMGDMPLRHRVVLLKLITKICFLKDQIDLEGLWNNEKVES